jgi:intracellular septation protein A
MIDSVYVFTIVRTPTPENNLHFYVVLYVEMYTQLNYIISKFFFNSHICNNVGVSKNLSKTFSFDSRFAGYARLVTPLSTLIDGIYICMCAWRRTTSQKPKSSSQFTVHNDASMEPVVE